MQLRLEKLTDFVDILLSDIRDVTLLQDFQRYALNHPLLKQVVHNYLVVVCQQ